MMAAKEKRLLKIIAGLAIYAFALIYHADSPAISLALFLAAYIVTGGDVILRAVRNLAGGRPFDEKFLMSIATIGAFAIGKYSEGVAVMLFYQIGEFLQSRAIDRSRKSIAAVMDIRPDYANVMRGKSVERIDPYEVKVGELIVVKPGERIPLDAVVMEGISNLDTSPLTGEPVPKRVHEGDEILSGCINLDGLLVARVEKEFADSTASRILDLVENAAARKSRPESFITKFARIYTPLVVAGAALLAVVPPLVFEGASFSDWFYRALVFLVISCPCALVISIPLGFFAGLGAAARNGILLKGSNYLETLARAEVVVFDKTGTLTKGTFKVQNVAPEGVSKDELLKLAAHAESGSNHPIALSVKQAYGGNVDEKRVSNVREISGMGLTADVDGRNVSVGNDRLMRMLGVSFKYPGDGGTVVHVAVDGAYGGYMVIADEIKEDAAKVVSALRAEGVKRIVMLTGDGTQTAEDVARRLGFDEAYGELLPDDKVQKLEELMASKSAKGSLLFVGDGINDAPVLARADVGIAMGGLGSDAAIEAADAVIMTDEPSKIPVAIKIAKKTLRIARENIAITLGVKCAVLVLGALGMASMWEAVFADVGVTLMAVLNAIRALKA